MIEDVWSTVLVVSKDITDSMLLYVCVIDPSCACAMRFAVSLSAEPPHLQNLIIFKFVFFLFPIVSLLS